MKLSLGLSILSLVALCSFSSSATAAPRQAEAPRSALTHYNLEKGLALSGYDPVAYFEVGGGEPAEGKSSISARHGGVTYRFSNNANRARFLVSPERFEPAYGGWCAYAMASGEKVEIDPERYSIENGRLLVFYDGFFGPNTLKKWRKEGPEELGRKATASWKKIAGESLRDLRHHNLDQGLALSGHDPVSYFAVGGGQPKPGLETLATTHGGVTYRFVSEANRTSFLANPEAYVPRYGGYCAWAMSQGKKVEVDLEAFTLTNGKLHLFYNASKRDAWKAEVQRLQPAAEKNWKALHETR